MDHSSLNYDMEYWEFDFLAKHFLGDDYSEVPFYDEDKDGNYAEIVAKTERQGSTVIFHAKRDNQNTWLEVFSLNEGDNLGSSYLEKMTERRVSSVAEESRSTYGLT
jgi:hypothetical protein